MSTKQGKSFILTYDDIKDPTSDEMTEVVNMLRRFEAHEVLPGTLRLTGVPAAVFDAVRPLDKWHLSTEQVIRLRPPHKVMF